ncbi:MULTISPECIES: O-antigen ligase family protein [unclassified Streptomyces]|uniref:O-antigen ligase family protein n=1 Tax=unclassified Streptomyces TaxID=2593676 RepID=UPI0033F83591
MVTGRPDPKSLSTAAIGRLGLPAAGSVAVYLALFHGVAAAAGVVAICFGLVVWPRPDVALLMLLALVPAVAAVDPGGTTLPAMALGAVVLLVLLRVVLGGSRLCMDLLLISFIAAAVTVSWLMPQETFGVEHAWKTCGLLLVGLGLIAVSALTPPDPRRIAQVVAASGGGLATYLVLRGEYAFDRLTGLGLNPNYVGAALALPLVAAVGLVRFNRSWVWMVPAAVCVCAVLETRSRGAFVMAAAGLACVLLAGRPLRQKVLIGLALLAVTLVLPGTLDSMEGNLTGGRTSTELAANTEVRKKAALLAVRVALDHPLRGIGYAIFPEYARASPDLGIYINTHNDYLRLAAEAGLVTLVLWVVLLWRGLARRHTADHLVLQSLGVSYAAGLLFANALTDLVISTPFWISLGCLLARPADRGPDHTAQQVSSPPLPSAA